MNSVERIAYNLVKKNTRIKNILRDIYQGILSIVPKKKKESKYDVIEREGYFFGFHDKIPWSKDGSMLLAHKLNGSSTKCDYEIEIGYFKGENYTDFVGVGTTSSWNWQQGSMLQWVNNDIIFNCWNGQRNVSRIVDSSGNMVKEINATIGAVNSTGEFALSYSFERLNIGMPGYGYVNENDPEKLNSISKVSGLSLVNLITYDIKKLFSLNDIAKINPTESMNGAYHFFTHCLFAPKGNRFLFLHRWFKDGKQLYSRMISCNYEGKDIHIFPTGEMVSHITWISDKEVMAYCNTEKFGDGYHVFKDMSDDFSIVGERHFTSDGHPQYNAVNNRIITDTYPNRFRIQELSVYNIEEDKKEIIAKLLSPNKFKDTVRCDLHPRWNWNGDKICFDSAHTGVRSLCTINLEEDFDEV